METSTASSIDDLAACTTIEDYGDIKIVTIPGCSTISQLERTAIFNKAQQQHVATPLYADTLMSRLRCITPPLDEEEENEESRVLELQARKEMENEGCPPCYPPDLDIPLRNIPEKYQAITCYWKSFPGTDNVLLCAQLSEWQKFRMSQGRDRARYRNKLFSKFEDEVRERRRSHEVGGDVRLLLDPQQQSRLENWTEFQNYHLKRLERFIKKREGLKKELADVWKKSEVSGRAGDDAKAVRQELGFAESDLERHKILLEWIEQERRTMDSAHPTPVEEDNDEHGAAPKAVGRTSNRNRRTRRPETSALLGKPRVTKAKLKEPNTQIQNRKVPEIEPAIQDSDVLPQSRYPVPAYPRRNRDKLELDIPVFVVIDGNKT